MLWSWGVIPPCLSLCPCRCRPTYLSYDHLCFCTDDPSLHLSANSHPYTIAINAFSRVGISCGVTAAFHWMLLAPHAKCQRDLSSSHERMGLEYHNLGSCPPPEQSVHRNIDCLQDTSAASSGSMRVSGGQQMAPPSLGQQYFTHIEVSSVIHSASTTRCCCCC